MLHVESTGKQQTKEEKKAQRQQDRDDFWSSPPRPTVFPTQAIEFKEGPLPPAGCDPKTVGDVLDLYFPSDLISMMTKQSNLYAAHHDIQLKTFSAEDIYRYLTVIVYMGVQHNINRDEMFSSDPRYSTGFCSSVMPRNRFVEVKRCLAVANPDATANAVDRLAKVRPFLDLVRRISQSLYRPHQWLSLDETSLQCAHRNARVAYRAQAHKKRRDFIKIVCVNEAGTAYCVDFLVDERNGRATQDLVMTALSRLPADGAYTVATDRFYTSIATAEALLAKGVYMYGTLRTNGGIHSDLQRTFPEGFVKGFFSPKLSLWGWKDSGDVIFLSTFHGGEAAEVQRRAKGVANKVTRPAPRVAVDYNENMGAGDQFNSLMEGHSCAQVHQQRWYMSLVYYGIDQLLINANVFYNNLPDTNPLDSKAFRKAAVDHFLAKANQLQRGPRRAEATAETPTKHPRLGAHPSDAVVSYFDRLRLAPGDHLVLQKDKQIRCKLCNMKTKMSCTSCNLSLCVVQENVRDCYRDFHNPNFRISHLF